MVNHPPTDGNGSSPRRSGKRVSGPLGRHVAQCGRLADRRTAVAGLSARTTLAIGAGFPPGAATSTSWVVGAPFAG
jgi:hypothetical protein